MVQMLTERYRERLVGVLSCYDRIVITGRGKCLHYYFYFIDPQLGLCYLRVPTWCPFRLSSTSTATTSWPTSSTSKASATG